MSEKSITTRENNVIVRREAIYGDEKVFSDFNKVWVSGIIEEEFEYSHKVSWEKFYKTRVRVTRLSGTEDYVPIVVSELLMSNILKESLKGKYVEVGGQFRSHNRWGEDNRTHLDLFLFAKVINVCESEEDLEEGMNENLIFLDGYIRKPPIFRTTPSGRYITELNISVDRYNQKSDYIHCIAWGRIAMYASKLKARDRIKLYGRVQSRKYFKKFSPESEEGEYMDVYEISISELAKNEDICLED